jgi:hypothetical protein
MDRRLVLGLRELHRLLSVAALESKIPLRFALVGGLAVATWGAVRATQDIDFLADSDPSPLKELRLRDRLKKYIEQQGGRAEWLVGGHDDPIPLLLRIGFSPNQGTVAADILWAHKRWQRDALQRAIAVDVAGDQVPVLHPEDLILMKLEAGGPQDLLDVQELLSASPPQLDVTRLRDSARRLRLGKVLDECLRAARKR